MEKKQGNNNETYTSSDTGSGRQYFFRPTGFNSNPRSIYSLELNGFDYIKIRLNIANKETSILLVVDTGASISLFKASKLTKNHGPIRSDWISLTGISNKPIYSNGILYALYISTI